MEPLLVIAVFSTVDLDEGEEFASNIWERNRSTVTDGRYGFAGTRSTVRKVQPVFIEHDCAVDLKAQGPLSDHFRCSFIRTGRSGRRCMGGPSYRTTAMPVTHSPGMDWSLDRAVQAVARQHRRGVRAAGDGATLPNSAAASRVAGRAQESDKLQIVAVDGVWLAAEVDRRGRRCLTPASRACMPSACCSACSSNAWRMRRPATSETVEDASRAQVRKAQEWIEANLPRRSAWRRWLGDRHRRALAAERASSGSKAARRMSS